MEKNIDELKKMFADYQKGQSQKNSQKLNKSELLTKYFVPKASKEIFRILPYKGKLFYDKAFFHTVTLNTLKGLLDGVKVYCPAHNDAPVQKVDKYGELEFDLNGKPVMAPSPCPLCDTYKREIVKQDLSIKYIKVANMTPQQLKIKENNDKIFVNASRWEAKEFYIVKGIDKGQEKDGTKFWRFKHNYKRQGVLDKLMPSLEDFVQLNSVDFADPEKGTDITITTGESEFKGQVYTTVSAITTRGQSKLHQDKLIAEQWLNDTTTWRDVFKPKSALGITPYQYLELVLEGNNPYFDDTDQGNKHWVFPNHPELLALAESLKKERKEAELEEFEYASDIDEVSISNVTHRDVGTYTDHSVNVGAELENEVKETEPEARESAENFDDLPF
jgi:hypothetical protein